MTSRHLAVAALVAAVSGSAQAGVVLIPDSGNDKVWAFDDFDGHVVNPNFIPTHPSIPQPINAIDSGHGTILVSDETTDTVQEFNPDGSYVGIFADAADGLDGPNGLTRFGGQIYVTSNINGNIVRLDDNGSNSTIWASGFGTPRDIIFRNNDALVSESNGDDIVSLSLGGSLNGIWHNSDGVSGVDFPQQLQLEGNGNVLAAGFTAPFGLYTYDTNGVQLSYVGAPPLPSSPRGVFRLGNGKLLWTGGTRVEVYDPIANVSITIVNQAGTSFRYIESTILPTPGSGALLALAGAAILRRRRA